MTAVDQVERVDTVDAKCSELGCPWWQYHDRTRGDLDDPDFAARRHQAETGHTVLVTATVRTVTEYATADTFVDLTDQRSAA